MRGALFNVQAGALRKNSHLVLQVGGITLKTAVVPGTFDPITLGHMSVIEYAAKNYDRVFVAVMDNAEKTPVCPPETRVELIEKCVSHLKNVSVQYRQGMLYDFVKELGGADIVKGIRNGADVLYEKAMADYNKRFCGADTVYIIATGALKNVISTAVRKLAAAGENVKRFVPD